MADYPLPKIPPAVSDAETARALDQFEREEGRPVAHTEQLAEPEGDRDYLDTFVSEEGSAHPGEFKPVPLPPARPPRRRLFLDHPGAISGLAVAASLVAFVMLRPAVPEFEIPPGWSRPVVPTSSELSVPAPPARPPEPDTRPTPAGGGVKTTPDSTITMTGTVDPVRRSPVPTGAAPAPRPAERTTALPVAPSNSEPSIAPPARAANVLELTSAETEAPAAEPPTLPSLPLSTESAPPPVSPVTAASATSTSPLPPAVEPAPEPSPLPAAVEPAPEPPPQPAVIGDTTAIELVLGRYRSAFSALDVGAARGVWPTVNERALDRAFERLEKQEISFNRCSIGVAGARAEADCSGTVRYVPKVGSKDLRVDSRAWKFGLRKVGDDWSIDTVEAR